MTSLSDGAEGLAGDGLTFRWWHILVAVVAILLIGLIVFVTVQPVQVLPRMTLAPGYLLLDQDGNRLTSEDVRGGLTLYNFTYTHCAEGCAETGSAMYAIQERLKSLDSGDVPVRLVTISFDPERDTPETMKAWAEANGADPDSWTVATGEPDQLKTIIGGAFNTYYKDDGDGDFTFDPVFVLVDGNGIIRMKYRTAAPDPEVVTRDVGLVVKEVQNSSGASKLAYEAAHLFLCYPE
jgi:protein SCO1/2